jgi:hypothetical protein
VKRRDEILNSDCIIKVTDHQPQRPEQLEAESDQQIQQDAAHPHKQEFHVYEAAGTGNLSFDYFLHSKNLLEIDRISQSCSTALHGTAELWDIYGSHPLHHVIYSVWAASFAVFTK